MKNRITLKDISIKTGFTVNTTSRALKDKDDISEKTKTLIKNTAKQMGYVPNLMAGALRSGKTKIIAVILPDVSNPFFGIIMKEVEFFMGKSEYHTFILNTDEQYNKEKEALFSAVSKNVDGIIICPVQENKDDLSIIKEKGIPFVLLGRHFDDMTDEFDYVISDDINGAYLATEHLIKKGHNRILFLNGPKYISSAKERLDGYKRALKKNCINIEAELIKEIDITIHDCTALILEALQKGVHFTAIFAFSDIIAWQAIYALKKMNLKIPEDIAVVGYDNVQSRFFYSYPITTVHYSKREMARLSVEILLNKINHPEEHSKHSYILKTELVVRKST